MSRLGRELPFSFRPLPAASRPIAPFRRLFLGNARLSHRFDDLFASFQESRIIAPRTLAIATDRESGIEGKAALECGPRLADSAELREGGGQQEMADRIILINFERPAIHDKRRLVVAEEKLTQRNVSRPNVGVGIVRADAQRIEFMTLGLLGICFLLISALFAPLREADRKADGMPMIRQNGLERRQCARGWAPFGFCFA
jgi:hypothetical protein